MAWVVAGAGAVGAVGAVAAGATSVRDRVAVGVAVVAGDGGGATDWVGPRQRPRPSWPNDDRPCDSGAAAAATAAAVAPATRSDDAGGDDAGGVGDADGAGEG